MLPRAPLGRIVKDNVLSVGCRFGALFGISKRVTSLCLQALSEIFALF